MPDFALAPYILAMTGASVLIALVARLPLALKRCPCPADYLRRPRDGDTQPPANRPAPSTDGLSGDHRALHRLAKRHGLRRASELDPFVEPGSRLAFAAWRLDPEFIVIDVVTACHRASSICEIGIVGFAGGSGVFF